MFDTKEDRANFKLRKQKLVYVTVWEVQPGSLVKYIIMHGYFNNNNNTYSAWGSRLLPSLSKSIVKCPKDSSFSIVLN